MVLKKKKKKEKKKPQKQITQTQHPPIQQKTQERFIKKKNKKSQNQEKYNKNGELDMKDLLAMAAFDLALQNVVLKERNDTSPFTDKIQELTTELEGYLKK